jgi:hypothetical protein
MAEMNITKFSSENLKERSHLVDISIRVRILLKCKLRKHSERM